ncbi:MAG: hypothetical protein JWM33_3693 [Caulobacteraceae bacterium]|nr:hypothetical protein [Caulobacteraceae bacterium]
MYRTLRTAILALGAMLVLAPLSARSAAPATTDPRVYELRVYTANPDKLAALEGLLRAQSQRAYSAHGIEEVFAGSVLEGATTDADRAPRMFVEILSHPSRAAADSDWAAVAADPAWKAAWTAAEASGPLLTAQPVSTYMQTTDFSPPRVASTPAAAPGRVFELRRYNTGVAGLDNTVNRFRAGMAKIIADTGMVPISYWTSEDRTAFIYLVQHQDRETARKAWSSFMAPFQAFTADYNTANGAYTGPRQQDENRFLTPAEFSPLR